MYPTNLYETYKQNIIYIWINYQRSTLQIPEDTDESIQNLCDDWQCWIIVFLYKLKSRPNKIPSANNWICIYSAMIVSICKQTKETQI